MNTKQALQWEKDVLESAKLWVNGESCIGSQYELVLIAEKYHVKLPQCMHHFIYSNSPDHVKLTGAHKTVMKTLAKLAISICKSEGISCKYPLELFAGLNKSA